MAYVPPLNGGRINASISGNTAGALSVVSTGTVVLAGGNNVTLSQNANTISISAGNQTVQTQNLHNLIINGNTTGTTANISSGTMSLAGGNNITLSQAGGNAVTISAANQSNQSLSFSAGSQSTLTATGTFDARSYFLNGVGAASVGFSQSSVFVSVPQTSSVIGSGIVNFSSNGSSVTISAPAFSAGINSTNTVSNQFLLTAGNNVTLSQSTDATGATVSIGAANQTNQTLSFSAGSQSTLTATGTFDARSYFLNGVGAASVGFSASSVFVSVPTQSVESQSIGMHTSTAGGGTAGTSGSASGGQIRYNFYAGSNVTLSQSVNGASGSLSVYGGAAGGIALGDGANTISSGTARFSNSNGVSFGFNGQTITGSVAAQSNQTLGMYVLNNSVTNAQSSTSTLDARSISLTNYGALSAGFSGGSIQLSAPATSSLVGTNGISISSAGSTISVMPAAISTYVNMFPASTSSVALGALGGTNSVEFYPVSIPSPLVFNALRLAYTASFVTSTISGAQTLNHSFGLYSNNAGTLSLISSSNMGFSMTNSSVSGTMSYATSTGTGGYGYDSTSMSTTAQLQSLFGQGGWRVVDLQFGNSMSVTPGMYWLGFLHRGSSANANIGMALNFVGNAIGILNYGAFGSSSAAMTSNSSIKAPYMGLGYYNASSALPSAAAISSINQTIGLLPIMTFIST